jgi:hypothetical protein
MKTRKYVPFDFKVPSVDDGYQLANIELQTIPLKEPDLEVFKKEAESSGKNYFTKTISESEASKLLRFKFVKDKKEIMFSIFRAEGIDMYTDASTNKTIKTIKIGNTDAFYYKDKYTISLTLREEIAGSEHLRTVTKNGNTYEEICKDYIQYDAFVCPIENGVTENDLINLLEGLK